jgi:hypothetical protein
MPSDFDDTQKLARVLRHHQTILGYTITATRAAIKEMRESKGALSEVMHQRAGECEEALESILEFHER